MAVECLVPSYLLGDYSKRYGLTFVAVINHEYGAASSSVRIHSKSCNR